MHGRRLGQGLHHRAQALALILVNLGRIGHEEADLLDAELVRVHAQIRQRPGVGIHRQGQPTRWRWTAITG